MLESALEPRCHNDWSSCPGVHAPQQEKPLQWEARAPQLESCPYLPQREKSPRSNKDPAATAAKSLQSCPTLWDPIDSSPPGSPVPGILQARTLEWVAISFSNAWKWKGKVNLLSHVRLLATSRTAAYQAPPSMGFSRQEYWSGVPLPSPKDPAQPCPTK